MVDVIMWGRHLVWLSLCVCIVGCHVPRKPIEQRLAPKLEKLDIGMTKQEFKQILPEAYPKGQKDIGGHIVEAMEVKDSAADFTLLVYIPFWEVRDEYLWFYFYEDYLLKWGAPGSWPSEPDSILELRHR
jgi:hypothetical protein